MNYSFASLAIGPAAADRHVIGVFEAVDAGGVNYSVNSFTIGGVAATALYASANNGGTKVFCYGGLIPSGTTATVAVTISTGANRAAVSVYSATGLNSLTPTDTDEKLGNPTFSIDVLAGGFVLAAYCDRNSGTISWTGLTKDTQTTAEVEFSTASGN